MVGPPLLRVCVAPAIVRRSLVMALVVGPILTLINQHDALFGPVAFDLAKMALTFVVPYMVATVSAVATRREDIAKGAGFAAPCQAAEARLSSPRPEASGGARESQLQPETARMKARVHVTLKTGVLDPQGKAIAGALESLGFSGLGEVRQGKVIDLELEDSDPAKARARVEAMCRALLANTVIEDYAIELEA